MATKSFLKNISIKTAKQVHNLINALENSEQHCGEEVVMSRAVNELPRDQIKNFVKNIRGILMKGRVGKIHSLFFYLNLREEKILKKILKNYLTKYY